MSEFDENEVWGHCRACGEELPEDSRRTRRYCDDKCRARFQNALKKAGDDATSISDARKQMKALAFENLHDEVRSVLRQEIRETINQHVKDNVLGAAEVMSHMLPEAMAAVKQDLESEDWMARSRAYALVLKYAMAMGQEDAKDDKPSNIVVISNIPTPDTPLGHAVVEQYETLPRASEVYDDEDGEVEDFERGWPKCELCKQRKPAANMYEESKGDGRTRWICTSCNVARHYKRGEGAPDKLADDPLYGPEE